MLKISHLSVHYGQKQVLSDITFTLQPQRLTVLVGRNGAGKSTLPTAAPSPMERKICPGLRPGSGPRPLPSCPRACLPLALRAGNLSAWAGIPTWISPDG